MLIVGTTESGKSRLAKKICATRCASPDFDGVAHLVLDPMGADWGEEVEVVATFDELHAAIIDYHAQKIPCCVYVDEADIYLSMSHRANWWLLSRGRHYGLSVTVITQRPAMVAPSVRGMCSTLHAFSVSESDAKMLANDFALRDLATCLVSQRQGAWHHVRWVDGQKKVDSLAFPE